MKSISSVDATRDGFSFNPYRYIVRQKVLRSFAHLSVGDASEALALMARDVTYTFEGEHALGGTRISRAGVEKWFARLLRLLPGRFQIRRIDVIGMPWRTRVYTVFEDTVTPAFGAPYVNQGVQVVELVWGRAKRIHTYVNTAKMRHALDVLAEHGVLEARADPIAE
jgi:ketosteroid isomerase-like protein